MSEERLYIDYFSNVILPLINGKFRELYDKNVEENPDVEHKSWDEFMGLIDERSITAFRYNFMKIKNIEWKKGMVIRHCGYGRHGFKYFDYPEQNHRVKANSS